jgi:hypothetical protein
MFFVLLQIPAQGDRITNSFLIKYLETAHMEGLEFVDEPQDTGCENNVSSLHLFMLVNFIIKTYLAFISGKITSFYLPTAISIK